MTTERLLAPTATATAPALIAQVLEEAGIDMVFGISGGHTGKIFAALEQRQDTIRTVLVREESLAAVMAEVYGKLTRKPGVILGQGPWVLGNGLLGTIEAKLSASPMLLLTDLSDTPSHSLHGPYQSGTGEYGNWDAKQSFSGITKETFVCHDGLSAVHATQLGIKHALTGQPGPVAVLFSISALDAKIDPNASPRLYNTRPYLPKALPCADTAGIDNVIAAIAASTRPVIIAGNGVRLSAAYQQLQNLAERLGIPVVTTPSGKGCLPETHECALGVFGTFGTPAANQCLSQADLVLVIGSKLTASDTAKENPALLNPERQTFVQIDTEARNASWTYPIDHVLLGDAGLVMQQILDRAEDKQLKRFDTAYLAEIRDTFECFNSPHRSSDAIPMLPQRLIAELEAALPDNAIVTCDAGENRIFMTHFFRTKSAGTFIQAAGAGPMGYAIPAALAAKLVNPDSPVVAVCGDGGFSMTMNGLLTSIEQSIPIVTVIFNNNALGWSMHSRGEFATKLADFNYAAIAQSMGCDGVRVETPDELRAALKQAIESGKTTVIDAKLSLAVSFSDITSALAK